MEFKSYASSSAGNCYSVSDGQTRVLLECGVSLKELQKLSGFSLSEFQACLVSHEHRDHSKSAQQLINRGMEVYMSQGTAEALGVEGATLIDSMEQFSVGSFDIVPFTTFHNVREPLGFLIKSRVDGDILAFAIDTVNLRYKFPGLNILAIEANYDKNILERCERMPESKRYRVTNSHMEIDVLCSILRRMDLSRCREIHLLHLSDATSHEGHFINKVARAVPKGIEITACEK